jgi:transketolase
MFASHHQLNNLCGIVDRNGLITHGTTESINRLEPFKDKWLAFGWNVVEVDGHDIKTIVRALNAFKRKSSDRPTLILANTVKGKGVSFMENQASWHHGGIDDKKLELSLLELGA